MVRVGIHLLYFEQVCVAVALRTFYVVTFAKPLVTGCVGLTDGASTATISRLPTTERPEVIRALISTEIPRSSTAVTPSSRG